jgi:NADH-quinone oxidoreductase subunit K
VTDALFNYLIVGAVLFTLGAVGFLTRRNLIVMFLSAELMLQGVALNLVAFGRYHGNLHGQSFAIFVLTVAACEAAIAMALVVVLFQRRHTLDVGVWSVLSESPRPELAEESAMEPEPQKAYPALPPAGLPPKVFEREYADRV